MKFLCPQCKAKYRIADEKLAERQSSRMKCRKCGHVIDIHSATVPDDSIPPPGVVADAPAGAAPRKSPGVPRVGGAGGQPRRPVTTGRRQTGGGAAKRPVPPPRRVGSAAVQAVAEKAPSVDEPGLVTSPAATKPALTKPSAEPISKPDVEPVPPEPSPSPPVPEPAPKSEFAEDEPTRIHDGSSLAMAFSNAAVQSVAEATAPAAGDEWYIGIDGTPIGPVGLSVLREKAAERKATFESLVWREGFEEWKPLKEFPELVALVEEARRDIPHDENDLRTIPAPSPLEAQLERPRVVASDVPADLLEQIGAHSKGVSHPVAWTAVVVAIVFGVTVGSVLLSKTEKTEVVKYVEVPASGAVAASAPSSDPVNIEESTVSAGTTKRAVTTAQKTEPSPPPSTPKTGLSSLNGLNGLNGLAPAPQTPDVAANNGNQGGQLDGNAIQRVVANFSNSVRRGCWDTALASRAPDAPSTARVSVSIVIAPSGAVESVTTGGDPKGYPNLAHCIEAKVHGWRFPRSSGTTTAQVPFVFAAQ